MRASIVVPADKQLDPLDLLSVWRDLDYRFSWDDRCVSNTVHCKLEAGTPNENEIGYYQGSAPPPGAHVFCFQCSLSFACFASHSVRARVCACDSVESRLGAAERMAL